MGGISTPEMYSLNDAREFLKCVPKNTKIVKIRVTHEVIAEVIV